MAQLRLIKKYPNRRLYDTERSRYVVISDIRALIRDGVDVQILDSKSGEDITRDILLQIVTRREAGPDPVFSAAMLMHFIRCCEASNRDALGAHLEQSLTSFADRYRAPAALGAHSDARNSPEV